MMKLILAICTLLSLSFAGELKVFKKEVGDVSTPKESKEYMKKHEATFEKKIDIKIVAKKKVSDEKN